MSFASLFLQADEVVKTILGVLLLLSVVSWAIIIGRGWAQFREERRTRAVEAALDRVGKIDDLEQLCARSEGAAARVLEAIHNEWDWSRSKAIPRYELVRQRLMSMADLAISGELVAIAGRTSLLATIGSVSPFIGLFGTVWGIMRSFIQIGQYKDVTIAVVAPGIAEALMATAVGLFAAIPAVIAYNRLTQGTARLVQRWHTIAGSVEVAISRSFQAGA